MSVLTDQKSKEISKSIFESRKIPISRFRITVKYCGNEMFVKVADLYGNVFIQSRQISNEEK